VIAIASERGKGDAVLGALRSGMVNVLVTNLTTARTVLDLCSGSTTRAARDLSAGAGPAAAGRSSRRSH
jgi:hypothetical protein